MRQLRLLRHEWALQMSTVRFRVGIILYLLLSSLPPWVEFLLLEPTSPHTVGPSTYLGAAMQAQRLATVFLAILLAGNRAGISAWRDLWVVLSASPATSGQVLIRRWISVSLIASGLSMLPTVSAYAASWAAGAVPVDPWNWLASWIGLILPIALFVSAYWLAATTILGSEVGAVGLFFLMRWGGEALAATIPSLQRLGGFPDLTWLGFWEARMLIWYYFYSIRARQGNQDTEGWPIFSDVPIGWPQALEQAWPQIALSAGFSIFLLGVATAFLRRTRPDTRPSRIRETHPLRTFLVHLHSLRRRYAPDAGLRTELWLIALGSAVLSVSVLALGARQSQFSGLAAERYRAETELQDIAPAPPELTFDRWRIKGSLSPGGDLEARLSGRLTHGGAQPLARIPLRFGVFLRLEELSFGEHRVKAERAWDRLLVELDPPLEPGEQVEVSLRVKGRPRTPVFPFQWSATVDSFVTRYQAAHRADGARRFETLAYSTHRSAITRGLIDLAPHQILPLIRYTTWKLSPPPATRDDRGNEVRRETHFPAAELEIDLRIPQGRFVADTCGNTNKEGALRAKCRMAPGRYRLKGGLQGIVASDGQTTLAALPGHEDEASRHFEILSTIIRKSGSAWPGLPPIEKLVVVEWPPAYDLKQKRDLRFFPGSDELQAEGALVTIPERRLLGRREITAEAVIGRLLVARMLTRRSLAPSERIVFEGFLSGLMADAMGVATGGGATITGAPWSKAQALQPISSAHPGNRMLFEHKLPALAIDLENRVGSSHLHEAVEAFFAADSGSEAATARDLIAQIEASSGVDLQTFYDQYWDGHALPELRLGEMDVESDPSGGFVARGKLFNDGPGQAICPVILRADGQEAKVNVTVNSRESTSFQIRLDQRPHTALLDPEKTCFRWVSKGSPQAERIALGESR